MLVSKSKFKMAALECVSEFMTFAHFYGICEAARKRRDNFIGGHLTFETAEYKNPSAELEQRYTESVKRAANKLLVLDRKFHDKNGEHIVAYLDTFEDFEKALEEISNISTQSRTN